MEHEQNSARKLVILYVTLGLAILVVVVGLVLFFAPKSATNYSECAANGGRILETYPEQCSINGQTFVNDNDQPAANGTGDYIGLTETEAIERAREQGVAARVVERDGEELPVTADFSVGRYNLYIKGGKVYKVEIEK